VTRRTVIAWIGVAIALIALGVVVVSTFGGAPRQTETGLVTAVDSAGLADVRGFTIRTDDGRTISFRIGVLENGAQFPPGHLLEHRATGARIVVTYRSEGSDRYAVRLDDVLGPSAMPSAS
jgi:hypothetical protein